MAPRQTHEKVFKQEAVHPFLLVVVHTTWMNRGMLERWSVLNTLSIGLVVGCISKNELG